MERQNNNDDRFVYEIKEHIAILGTNERGWTKEVNLVSFRGDSPKIDLREWSPDHNYMGKGFRMTEEEAATMAAAIADRYIKKHPEDFKRPEWTPEPVKQEVQKQEADIVPFRVKRSDPQPLAPAPEKPKTETPKKVKQSAPARKPSKINVPADIKLPF